MQASALRLASARTEELDPPAREAIINLCIAAHGTEDFRNLFIYVPSGGLHFLAYHGAQLAGHAMVTTRWLQPDGLPLLKTAYVDAVSVLPQLQGQGVGSTLMRRLAAEIDSAYQVACLETDRQSFYTRLGWQAWRGPLAGRSDHGLVPTPNQGGILLQRLSATPALDFDSLLTIECQPGRIWYRANAFSRKGLKQEGGESERRYGNQANDQDRRAFWPNHRWTSGRRETAQADRNNRDRDMWDHLWSG